MSSSTLAPFQLQPMLLSAVFIFQKKYDVIEISENPERYSEILARAKKTVGYATCGCCDAHLRLVIRKVSDVYRLSLWPYEGQKHDAHCYFYRLEVQERVAKGFALQSIVESQDGTVAITPDFDLSLDREPKEAAPGAKGTATTQRRVKRQKAGLTALLRYLWESSECNQIRNRAATYWKTVYRLSLVMSQCKIGKEDMTSVSFMPDMGKSRPDWYTEFINRLKSSNEKIVRYGVLFGNLTAVELTKFGYRYMVQGLRPPLFVDKALQERIEQSFHFAIDAVLNPRGLNVWLAAQVELSAAGNLLVRQCGFLVTSRDFVPVDSMYEATFANKLVDEGRSFYKPMVIEDGLVPDFVLTDTSKPTYIEVWGMNTDSYIARRAEKIASYQKLGHALLEWDAASMMAMPQLPQKG